MAGHNGMWNLLVCSCESRLTDLRNRLIDEDERLVGMTLVGEDAAELLHAGTVAIVGRMKIADMVHCVPSFPTMSEVYLNLLEAAGY